MSISLPQYLLYLQYMLAGVAMTAVFGAVYLRITPAEELRLIKKRQPCLRLVVRRRAGRILSDARVQHCPQRQFRRFYPVGPCRGSDSDFGVFCRHDDD